MWAFEILAEEGFHFDSSVFPVRHDLYGVPDADRFPSWYTSGRGRKIFEFPPSTLRHSRQNIGVAGGGYLRFFPYAVTHWAIRNINEVHGQPAMVYFHPWEVDPEQPRIPTRLRSKFRHYVNLSTTEVKIGRLVQDFRFTTLSQASKVHKAYQAGITPMPIETQVQRTVSGAARAAGSAGR